MVIDELQKKHGYEEFCLWGRSMGAVSSILALDKLQSSGRGDIVKCAVFDAPFTKARTMVQFFNANFYIEDIGPDENTVENSHYSHQRRINPSEKHHQKKYRVRKQFIHLNLITKV